MNIIERKKVLRELIRVIDSEGSARVGWALKTILGKVEEHSIEKIAGLMTRSNRFIKSLRKTGDDYWIARNPQYRLDRTTIETNKSLISINKQLKVTNIIGIAFTALTTIFIAIDTITGCNKPEQSLNQYQRIVPLTEDYPPVEPLLKSDDTTKKNTNNKKAP